MPLNAPNRSAVMHTCSCTPVFCQQRCGRIPPVNGTCCSDTRLVRSAWKESGGFKPSDGSLGPPYRSVNGLSRLDTRAQGC